MTSDLSIALFIDFLNTCVTLGIYSKLGRSFVLKFSPANYIQCRNSMRRCFSILFIPRLCCVSHNSSHDGMLTTPFCLSIFSLSPGRFQKRKNFFLSSKNETLVCPSNDIDHSIHRCMQSKWKKMWYDNFCSWLKRIKRIGLLPVVARIYQKLVKINHIIFLPFWWP